jgi:L-threonylcarbamoyladenylate synthase
MVLEKTSENTIGLISECLKNNGVVIMPCDTIYGIVCADGSAEERIRQMKGRDENKPFIRLIRNSAAAAQITDDKIDSRILTLWPGPLTLIVNDKKSGTAALRVPQDEFLLKILSAVNKPLLSTSVNTSGMPSMNKISDIISSFISKADIIVDGGDLENNIPSTILDLTVKPYKILRQGSCSVPAGYLAQ